MRNRPGWLRVAPTFSELIVHTAGGCGSQGTKWELCPVLLVQIRLSGSAGLVALVRLQSEFAGSVAATIGLFSLSFQNPWTIPMFLSKTGQKRQLEGHWRIQNLATVQEMFLMTKFPSACSEKPLFEQPFPENLSPLPKRSLPNLYTRFQHSVANWTYFAPDSAV